MKPIVRMRVGSSQTVELSSVGLSFPPFYISKDDGVKVMSSLNSTVLLLYSKIKAICSLSFASP